jgi:hypothetical protein
MNKNKVAKILLALFCSFLATKLHAGLGETLEQAIQHYGPVVKQEQSQHLPQNEAGMMYEFNKDGFRIQIRLVGGRTAWILYLRDDRPIYETEIRTLLENNAEGVTWSTGTQMPNRTLKKKITFTRADSLADAEYEEFGTYHGLLIMTKAWRHATSSTGGL